MDKIEIIHKIFNAAAEELQRILKEKNVDENLQADVGICLAFLKMDVMNILQMK